VSNTDLNTHHQVVTVVICDRTTGKYIDEKYSFTLPPHCPIKFPHEC